MDQLLNQVFHERYRLESLLGRQTGRRTFLAHDLQTESRVVVKLLLFGPDFEWDDLKLFEREAAVLKSLDHPAIPHYLDAFDVETELGKGFALVQSYLEAPTLQAWIQSGRTFSESDLKAIAQELLGVLDYLHSRSPAVVHRDLKPSNILLGDRSGNSPGQVYLVDFGSVQTAVHGGTRTVVGTYGYMPPEQFGGQTSPAVDLYALGATLIYLATGQHPDQLPQRELRILFADRTSSLSPPFTTWLQALTEPSLDLRILSVKQALDQLNSPDPSESSLAIVRKPADSKVEIRKNVETFEIFVPPIGFRAALAPIGLFAVITSLITLSAAEHFIHNLRFTYSFLSACTSLNSCPDYTPLHLGMSGLGFLGMVIPGFLAYLSIRDVCYHFFGSTILHITQSGILKESWKRVRMEVVVAAITPQTVVKLRQITDSLRHLPEERKTGEAAPRITRLDILVGPKTISLSTYRDNLTYSELRWIAQELSSWLDVPIN
jgi:serine/threonine protein kinase